MVGAGAGRRAVRRRRRRQTCAGFGVDLDVPSPGAPGPADARLPLAAHRRRLAARRGRVSPAPGSGVGPGDLAALLADLPGPVGVLAMGDGSARRTVKAPGLPRRGRRRPSTPPSPPPWPSGTPPRWPRSTPARASGCWRPGCRRGGRSAPRWPAGTITARLHYDDAPFGVGYLVADWRRRVSAPPVVAVVGPTATGKTALAVALARRLGGEVVNADSMQLYRGMDIGTAKPDLAERGGVPHHLLDLLDVSEPASVAEYQRRARAEIDRLRAAGIVPLLVGGSALYVRAVLDELEFPGTDPAVRARLEAELAEVGAGGAARPAGRRSTRRPRRPSCPATAAGSCARWRSSS